MRFLLACVCIVGAATAFAADEQATGTNVIPTATGPLVIHPLEHATFVMQWGGKTIAVDPVGDVEAFADFPKPDLILITDIHGDHLSSDVVAALATATTTIIAPAAAAEKLPTGDGAAVKVLANGASTTWQGATVEAIPMYNLDPKKQKFHPKGRGNGYLITLGGKRVYIAGDTEDIPEMRALQNIDAAFVCMNLPYTMDVAAAADAVLEFQPKVVFPYHYRGTDGMSDLGEFRALVASNPAIDVRVLAWY
ncbi:MAG: MBL fold metallo-hydrolase [Acidobacteriota bacterium]|nr:MBL fold metallo-hydrolase [Acidobacteriota bacterium]